MENHGVRDGQVGDGRAGGGSLLKWLLGLGASLFVAAGVTGWYKYYLGDQNRGNIQKASRADLDLVLQAERSFQRRFGFFTTDMVSLGVASKYTFYKLGFVKPLSIEGGMAPVDGHDPSRMDLDAVKKARPDLDIAYSSWTKLDEIDMAALARFCPDCTATATTFRALAAANLDDDPELDVWAIDHEGKIEHLNDDLRDDP